MTDADKNMFWAILTGTILAAMVGVAWVNWERVGRAQAQVKTPPLIVTNALDFSQVILSNKDFKVYKFADETGIGYHYVVVSWNGGIAIK